MAQLNDLSRRYIRKTGYDSAPKINRPVFIKGRRRHSVSSTIRWYKLGLSAILGHRVLNYLYCCNDFSLKNKKRNGSKVKIGYFSFIAALV